jgi:hypothetical protein
MAKIFKTQRRFPDLVDNIETTCNVQGANCTKITPGLLTATEDCSGQDLMECCFDANGTLNSKCSIEDAVYGEQRGKVFEQKLKEAKVVGEKGSDSTYTLKRQLKVCKIGGEVRWMSDLKPEDNTDAEGTLYAMFDNHDMTEEKLECGTMTFDDMSGDLMRDIMKEDFKILTTDITNTIFEKDDTLTNDAVTVTTQQVDRCRIKSGNKYTNQTEKQSYEVFIEDNLHGENIECGVAKELKNSPGIFMEFTSGILPPEVLKHENVNQDGSMNHVLEVIQVEYEQQIQ